MRVVICYTHKLVTKSIALCNYYCRNARRSGMTIDYRLVQICMFGSFESSFNFDCDTSSGSDNYSYFPFILSGKKGILWPFMTPNPRMLVKLGLSKPLKTK